MEEKKSATSQASQSEHTPSKPWLISSVFTWLVITALYIKEQMNSEHFDSQKSFYPALLIIPAILFMVAKKNSAPPVKPKTISDLIEKSTLLPSNFPASDAPIIPAILGESTTENKITDSGELKLGAPQPTPISDSITDEATDPDESKIRTTPPTLVERLCKALQDGADLLPSIFLVQSCISLVQNIMAETKNNELYTFTVIAGLATGALVEISLSAVKVFKVGLTSEIAAGDLPEKGIIYISVDGNFKYTLMDNHGEIHRDIDIPREKLDPSKFPDDKYPILLRTALKEHLPTILEITSKNGHTPNDPKFRRNLEAIISHSRNHVLLALQFVLSTVMTRRLPAVKGPFDTIASSVFTGFNWSRFVQNLFVKAQDSLDDTRRMRTPMSSIVERPLEMPVPTFACPNWVYDTMRALLGVGCIGSAFYLKNRELPDPELLIEWSAYWLDSVGGYFLGSAVGIPLGRLINSHAPGYRNLFTTLSNQLIVFLISPNLDSFADSIKSTALLTAAGISCGLAQEITEEQIKSQLRKREERKKQIEGLFKKHQNNEHMKHLFDFFETPDGQLLLKQHKKQYLALKKFLFNAVFFSYMVYKIASASFPSAWHNDKQNAWIDILTSINIAAMLFGFNSIFPKMRPARDNVDFLYNWSWKKFIFEPNFELAFMINVAFKIQYNPKFAGYMSLVANALLSNPMVLLFVAKASGVYEIQINGVEEFNTEDIHALKERLVNGYGKINRSLAQYFMDTYGEQLRAQYEEQPDKTDKKHSKRSKDGDLKAPLLAKVGSFKSPNREELKHVAADPSNVVYDKTSQPDPHHGFSESNLSGAIRGPNVSGNFSE
ncbi:MAG TPA: hypothetical protein VHE99_07455 [Gammaproteobacteria bacterium]|nr:hypothetical protein [Gammaproteobacteria bacterium]